MDLTLYELLYYFFLYSMAGWVFEVCYYSFKEKKFVNPGFLNGPWCPFYGFVLIFMIVAFPELKGQLFFEFLAFTILTSFLRLLTGKLLLVMFHRRWWDDSRDAHNIEGFISLKIALLWGAGSLVILKVIHPFVAAFVHLIPGLPGKIILVVLSLLFLVDVAGTCIAVYYWNHNIGKLGEITDSLQSVSHRWGMSLFHLVRKRMEKTEAVKLAARARRDSTVFAEGCCFYKLLWLFFIGAFLGDVTETIFCRLTAGVWMSRSSVVYGPFSIVWGMGVVLLTATLYRFYDKEDRYIFMAGTLLGGVYEYVCSVFTEKVFGTVFWDYSHIPFNIGGRINLLFCFFWGIAALVWLKFLYPKFSAWIEKIPKKLGKILSVIMIVFMIYDMILSSFAMARYADRNSSRDAEFITSEIGTADTISAWLDEHFPDERMEKIYPNAIIR